MQTDRLHEPFDVTYQRPGPGGTTLTYIRPVQVMDRLDEVFGVGGWSCEYQLLHVDAGRVAMKCRIAFGGGAYVEGIGEATSDAAGGEAFKAAASDALKRAAVHLGVARYLYEERAGAAAAPRTALAQGGQPQPQQPQQQHRPGETWTDANGELRIQCPDHGGWWAMQTRDGGIKCKKRIGDGTYCTYTVYPGQETADSGNGASGDSDPIEHPRQSFTPEVEAQYQRLLQLQREHGWTGQQLAAAFGVREVTPRMIKQTMADGMTADEIDAMVMDEVAVA